jgi:hypothetical protein
LRFLNFTLKNFYITLKRLPLLPLLIEVLFLLVYLFLDLLQLCTQLFATF